MYTIYTTFKERRITSSVTKACHYLALRVQQRNSTLRVAGLSATSQLMLPHCCVCQVREELVHVRRANVSINCNCGIICNVSLFLSFLLWDSRDWCLLQAFISIFILHCILSKFSESQHEIWIRYVPRQTVRRRGETGGSGKDQKSDEKSFKDSLLSLRKFLEDQKMKAKHEG